MLPVCYESTFAFNSCLRIFAWKRNVQMQKDPQASQLAGLSSTRKVNPLLGPLTNVRSASGPGEPIAYLIRMSFLTDFTPATPRASSTALFAAVCELTKPLS